MDIAAIVFFVLYLGLTLAVGIFLLVMLYRFVKAHEAISRHLFEIAKDHKKWVNED